MRTGDRTHEEDDGEHRQGRGRHRGHPADRSLAERVDHRGATAANTSRKVPNNSLNQRRHS
jgi:hypothetical protein